MCVCGAETEIDFQNTIYLVKCSSTVVLYPHSWDASFPIKLLHLLYLQVDKIYKYTIYFEKTVVLLTICH